MLPYTTPLCSNLATGTSSRHALLLNTKEFESTFESDCCSRKALVSAVFQHRQET